MIAPAFDARIQVVVPALNGLFDGCAYGLIALGLVLLYKSNRIFNFAQGEFASVGAFTASAFLAGDGFLPKVPYPLALALGVVMSVLVAVAAERLVVQPLFTRPRVVLVIGTVGVALLLIAVQGMIVPQGRRLQTVASWLGVSDNAFYIDKVNVTSTQVLELGSLVVLGVLAIVFFSYVPQGTAILAVSQDVTAARVVGISVSHVSMLTWGLAGFLGGVGGVVLGADQLFTPGSFTAFLLIPGFAAAVFGGMTSLPGAFVGGILLGEVQAFADRDSSYIAGLKSVPGSPKELAVFAVVLIVLLVRPRGLLGKEA